MSCTSAVSRSFKKMHLLSRAAIMGEGGVLPLTNISTSEQRCFNVVDQRWHNIDPTLKMKQNPASDFQSCTTLIQRQCPTLKQRYTTSKQCWNNVIWTYPANISTSDQRCFNVVDQCWNNVDPKLKMKQNPTSDFQRWTTLIQCQCPTLKKHRNNVTQRRNNVAQRWYNVVST